jgi:hypothetical protein
MTYVLGLDPGFASSPTGATLIETDPLRLIAARQVAPRCGGDWQRRCDDVLAQLNDWLTIELLPSYPHILLAYALPHLRERKEGNIETDKRARSSATRVLNAQTALRLADLGGGFRGLAVALGLECIGLQEAESKLALAKSSAATKADMIAAARQIFGCLLSEHEADACGHALAGEATWRRARLVREASGR